MIAETPTLDKVSATVLCIPSMCRTSVVNSDMYAKSLLSRGPRITYLRNREGRRLVVRVKREGAASRKYRM